MEINIVITGLLILHTIYIDQVLDKFHETLIFGSFEAILKSIPIFTAIASTQKIRAGFWQYFDLNKYTL